MGAEIPGRNIVVNPGFEWGEAGATFPEGWLPFGGDASTQWLWSTENPVEGTRTVKVVNPTLFSSTLEATRWVNGTSS